MSALVRIAPGAGHVARRPRSVVFLPRPDGALLEAFLTAPDGGELQAIASATVAAGFDVAPFVAVSWAAGVRVMAFGEIAVETDHPALPMLSGAGSRTWVEHSLASPDAATFTVAGAATASFDEATDLVAGVALAGGVQLRLEPADASRAGERRTGATAPAGLVFAGPERAVAGPGRRGPRARRAAGSDRSGWPARASTRATGSRCARRCGSVPAGWARAAGAARRPRRSGRGARRDPGRRGR